MSGREDHGRGDARALGVELYGGGRAMFTTRVAGNLSLAAGVGHERGLEARERLCRALGLERVIAGPQVHGTVVREVPTAGAVSAGELSAGELSAGAVPAGELSAGEVPAAGELSAGAVPAAGELSAGTVPAGGELPVGGVSGSPAQPLTAAADGYATARRGVGVMVLAADCVPVALGAPGAVAVVHAGWRGLAAGVLQEGARALLRAGRQGDGCAIHAVIGPCAGVCCYEVGREVLEALGLAAQPGRERAHISLRAAVRERLEAAGVGRVDDANMAGCTICDTRFFSHRREGKLAGRQAVVAWLD